MSAPAAGLSQERLDGLDAAWRAANYLGAAQLYLKTNALLKQPLQLEHFKTRLLGHWGTQPGLNFTYVHLNRLIQDTQQSTLLIVGPGHGAPATLATLYLEGTLGEYDSDLKHGLTGADQFAHRFSWPGGAPSHLVATTPGMIQEGGELGYSLSHAFGAALDNPDLLVACVVGDGEAETGPLAAAWQSPAFLNPASSGAVLPIVHLNGYKLSGPTVLGRKSDDALCSYFEGMGYAPFIVSGDEPLKVHQEMWAALDEIHARIRAIQDSARAGGATRGQPSWPVLILRTPKGWTGPKMLDGVAIEGTFHSHQVPIMDPANPLHLAAIESWLRSYRPQELFDENGIPAPDVLSAFATGNHRIGMNRHANGGALLKDLDIPDWQSHALTVTDRGNLHAEGTRHLGLLLRDIFRQNRGNANFRLFCPDETTSNRLDNVFEATARAWMLPTVATDENLSTDGRVMEILSEHTIEGWLEGYLLTGRHGLFACYEAFIPIVDSMLNQYAKWLNVAKEAAWRKPLASLNYLLTSHVWRQDHNGYSHQVPSFMNNVVNKKNSVARIYLPPDANCLLAVADHCLRSKNYVNLIVASKQNIPQWLSAAEAHEHCKRGASTWEWAGNDAGDPDVVLACAGDVPTEETLAAAQLLVQAIPEIRVRVVNVVDLFSLETPREHSHGLDTTAFRDLFTDDKPVIFAFHGYPRLIHELIYKRPNCERFHVHGYEEEGRTTTPFDVLVMNHMSRYHLAIQALEQTPRLRAKIGQIIDRFQERLDSHKSYIVEHGVDMPDIVSWKWKW
ncbi:MAG: phosphoketolase family protein [Candidatus Tyrphobacter sp.]